MHRLSRCSVSAALRAPGTRYRVAAAAPIASSTPIPVSVLSTSRLSLSKSSFRLIKTKGKMSLTFSVLFCRGSDNNTRWNSTITGGKCNTARYSAQLNLKNDLFLGSRYVSTATASDSGNPPPPPAEKYEYQVEVSRLLDLIVNSLYSNKEVNASDALDKLRYLSVTDPQLLKEAVDLDIRIQTDKDNGIITITDSGIGMTRQELVDLEQLLRESKDAGTDNNLIGQFGVGFYSAFLVSDKVVVSTKSPKSEKQYVGQGEANASTYTIREETNPENLIPRGTRLTLYLKRDYKGFAHPERIQKLVKNYSQFVSFPIYTWQEKGITKEVEVYENPFEAKEANQDENIEVVTFIRRRKQKKVVEKYWDWELTNETQPIWFPRYLSFVKGVVDSNDLPLNVSREILQESRIVRIMKKRLVRKTFDMIQGISMSENKGDYDTFWENYGKHLKLGCIEDRENHKRLAPLLRSFSSQSEDEMITLDEYVENMKPEQKDIYYIATDSMNSARNAPFLERLLEKDLQVLYLVDPIDEVAIQSLKSYKEKNFVDISKEDLDIGDKNEEKDELTEEEFSKTCDWIKKRLGEKVANVNISNRLSSSPCVLVSGKFGWSANMERLMKAQTVGDTSTLEFMKGRRVFEINPDHPIIRELNAAFKSNPDDEDALRAIDLLYDAALPNNPAHLSGKIYEMMGMAISGKWSTFDGQHSASQTPQADTLEAEVDEPVHAGGKKMKTAGFVLKLAPFAHTICGANILGVSQEVPEM
ncbi:Heat shock protein 89.1 isoform 2 [Hibiscus syriacus]|uniref:Heat shock protein 89.1 isoform 2 n=1 Tax=Hibiscus syriacus TaxID=106335 RepID=A0A6A2Z122_HIBSY|nr:Heat shock protein 89.1 isoform 2 [Hibiscus syriacus]